MEFKRTTAINKILSLKSRKKIIQGGSSAGKTYGIIPILIDQAAKTPNLEISVVSESIPHLKKGALKDFIKIMKSTGRWVDARFNATDRKYLFANGSYIEFFSPESVLGARRHILYVNEANNITYEDYHQLSVRTEKDIFIDFNPANEFWAHTEVLKEPDSEGLILTYLDNEGRPSNVDLEFEIARQKAQKEKELGVDGYWSNWCRVYIDGQIGSLQGVVFNNWHQIDDIPKDAEFVARGLDFGFTNDPTALIEVYKSFNKLFIKELLYETRLTGYDIAEKMLILNIPKHQVIVGDCARPETIEDLHRFGFNIEPSVKGADSVINSIDTLQQFEMYVTKDSTNLIKELRSYRWLTDRSGKALNEPIDHNNHLIDALRYVASNRLHKSEMFDVY